MQLLTKNKFLKNEEFYINEILKGKIFIYPTDTLYGIGCDATNDKSISKIFKIKKRENKPCLIIIPSINWAKTNLILSDEQLNYITLMFKKQYSFIVKIKDKNSFSKNVNFDQETIGIRFPNNWFTKIITKINKPFLTTSVNISNNLYATNIDNMDDEIKKKVDYIIEDSDFKTQIPSKIIDLTQNYKKIR